jgi:hypothetical protein
MIIFTTKFIMLEFFKILKDLKRKYFTIKLFLIKHLTK